MVPPRGYSIRPPPFSGGSGRVRSYAQFCTPPISPTTPAHSAIHTNARIHLHFSYSQIPITFRNLLFPPWHSHRRGYVCHVPSKHLQNGALLHARVSMKSYFPDKQLIFTKPHYLLCITYILPHGNHDFSPPQHLQNTSLNPHTQKALPKLSFSLPGST